MKTSGLLFLLAALLFSNGPASGAQSSLEGTWYVGGDRNKVARITERRRELEARNENGQTSRLEYEGRRRVRAPDWGGITGEIRGDRIEWSNNTYWSRARSSDGQYRQMVGTWYLEGDRNRVARITDNRGELEARNEHGQTTRLEYEGRGRVRAPDWGGITGEIRGNRIEWSNNTYWSRRAESSSTRFRQVLGTWYVGGNRNNVARITDNRGELEARNEHGQTSRLEYEGRGRVRATDWGDLTGEVRSDRIEWSNNTYWSRSAHRR